MEEFALISKLIIFCIFLLFLMSAFIIIASTLFKKRIDEMNLEKEVERQKIELKNLEAILHAQERERKTIADDLHDEVGATLSLVQKNLTYIYKNNGESSVFQSELLQSIELVDYSINAIRGISTELIPNNVIQLGLVKAIQQQLKFMKNTPFASCEFETNKSLIDIEQNRAIDMYRIFSELLNNIVKHSQAQNLKVKCEESENTFILLLQHNGLPFTHGSYLSHQQKSQGLGLKSVSNRLSRLKGTIQYKVVNGKSQIEVKIPLQ